MNLLLLDCAVTKFSIAVRTEEKFVCHTYDVGMKQSEILVPAIDDVLSEAGIKVGDLNYSALTIGPGSFTGLRLGISALKAIELSYNVPVYGVSSLKTYACAYENKGMPVLTCIDANKDKFYARLTDGEKVLLEDGDYEVTNIAEKLQGLPEVLIAGPDAKKLADNLLEIFKKDVKKNPSDTKIFLPTDPDEPTISLCKLALEMIEQGQPALQDYDGPVYLRASEAELALKNKAEK